MQATLEFGEARDCANRLLPLRVPPIIGVSIDEVNAPPSAWRCCNEDGTKGGNLRFPALHRSGRTSVKPEAGLLTRRSSLNRLAFPFRRTVAYCAGRSLLTVAGPCGICTRFPLHSPQRRAPQEVLKLAHLLGLVNRRPKLNLRDLHQRSILICMSTTHMNTSRTTLNLDEELLHTAREFTKIQEKTALIHEALRQLISREAGKRLAALGGTMPGFQAGRRRKSTQAR